MSDKFASALFQQLNAFAAEQTNPVNELLKQCGPFESDKRYPEDRISIAQGRIKAYYHSHESPVKGELEHGHFHLFFNAGSVTNPNWSHIAGLSIDRLGTPINWFTVNRWVTDGELLAIDALTQVYSWLEPDYDADYSIASWLVNMLGLFDEEIHSLYALRDFKLRDLNETLNDKAILDNRSVYALSCVPIDLQEKLHITLQESII